MKSPAKQFHTLAATALRRRHRKSTYAAVAAIVGEEQANYHKAATGRAVATLDRVQGWVTAWHTAGLDRMAWRDGQLALARPEVLLLAIEGRYPGLHEHYERARRHPPTEWPEWCYAPLAAAAALAKGPQDIAWIGAAAAWAAERRVWSPLEVPEAPEGAQLTDLLGLPRWCTWVEAPGLPGAWLHLEHDANDGRAELRIALDLGGHVVGIPVHLEHPSVDAAIDAAIGEAVSHAGGAVEVEGIRRIWRTVIGQFLPVAFGLLEPSGPS